jgi:hypothetical protein
MRRSATDRRRFASGDRNGPSRRRRHTPWSLVSGLIAAALALLASATPIATVYACSCAMPPTPAEIAEIAELAFVGTVVDSGPGPWTDFGSAVGYAFEVERASAIARAVLVVNAVESGASCGMTFGVGERWFVSAQTFEGTLSTGLCSGNVLTDTMAEAELDEVLAALPVAPVDTPTEGGASTASPILPIVMGGLGLLALAAVMFVAFRRQPDTS